MKKILVTGAGGFIGSFLVEEALHQDFEVWAGVRSSSSREYLQDERIQFIDLNFSDESILITQLESFKQDFGGWDYIVHNLGATKVNSIHEFDEINYRYTRNFVNALIAVQIIPRQFVYMSSLSVCGPFDEVGMSSINEEFEPCPNTAYGVSKRNAEKYLEGLSEFPFVILRPTGVYGPREKDYFLMLKTIQNGFDFSVGLSPQYLSFIYVRDLARVVFLAIEHNAYRRTYFVSDGQIYLSRDFRRLAQRYLNKKFVISIRLPLIIVKVVSLLMETVSRILDKTSTLNADKYKIMKQRNWNCDIKRLQTELSFEAQYNLEKGLSESIDWYKQSKWL